MGKYHITHDYDSLLDELLKVQEVISNRVLPQSMDWRNFRKIQAEAERNESKAISEPKQSENKEKAKLKQRVML